MAIRRKTVFLFSGQGSHYRGMGQKLYEDNPIFRKSMQYSNDFLEKIIRCSIIEELYGGKKEPFDDLAVTHPAIVAVELALLHTLLHLGISPDIVAGNSLGEFSAAVASGVWDQEDALATAAEQAKSFIRNGVEGGMIAIIGVDREKITPIYTKNNLFLASYNYNTHFTVSGLNHDLNAFQKELDEMKVAYFRLPISYPFHSPLVFGAKNDYLSSCIPLKLNKPKLTFVSGISAQPQVDFDEMYFWNAVAQYSSFPKLLTYLESFGPCLYIDIGPSGTSAAFVKNNLKQESDSLSFPIMTPFKREIQQLASLKKILLV